MSKATETELEALHAVVAAVLKAQLQATSTIIGEDGEEVEMSLVTPAIIAQAIKFLKDNNITATLEQGSDMESVRDMLAGKQKKGRLQLVDPLDEAQTG